MSSSKETIKIKVLDDLSAWIIFKTDETETRSVKLILPDIVKERWKFTSEKQEVAFASYASAISNEFINFGMSAEDVALRFKTLIRRTVRAKLMKRKNDE